MKFIADRTLGKLVKWLRIMGFDTYCYRGAIDRGFLERGGKEGRVVLTRRRDMAEREFRGRLVVIRSDRVESQISELCDLLSLRPDRDALFSRCIRCNELLQDIEKSDVGDRVPPYVYQIQDCFQVCPRCDAVYWAGTHRERMLSFMERHNLMDRP